LDDVTSAAERYAAARSELELERAHLYAVIRRAAAEGIPYSRIARAAGLSPERVRQIVTEPPDEPPADTLPHPRRSGNGG
jgi:hypothetical protein